MNFGYKYRPLTEAGSPDKPEFLFSPAQILNLATGLKSADRPAAIRSKLVLEHMFDKLEPLRHEAEQHWDDLDHPTWQAYAINVEHIIILLQQQEQRYKAERAEIAHKIRNLGPRGSAQNEPDFDEKQVKFAWLGQRLRLYPHLNFETCREWAIETNDAGYIEAEALDAEAALEAGAEALAEAKKTLAKIALEGRPLEDAARGQARGAAQDAEAANRGGVLKAAKWKLIGGKEADEAASKKKQAAAATIKSQAERVFAALAMVGIMSNEINSLSPQIEGTRACEIGDDAFYAGRIADEAREMMGRAAEMRDKATRLGEELGELKGVFLPEAKGAAGPGI